MTGEPIVFDRLTALLLAYAMRHLIEVQRRLRQPGRRHLEDILLDYPVERITILSDTNPDCQEGGREVNATVWTKRPIPGESMVIGVSLRWDNAEGMVNEEEVRISNG